MGVQREPKRHQREKKREREIGIDYMTDRKIEVRRAFNES